MVSLKAYVDGYTLLEAASVLKEWLDKYHPVITDWSVDEFTWLPSCMGAPSEQSLIRKANFEGNWSNIRPIPEESGIHERWQYDGINYPSVSYEYTDTSGKVIGYAVQYNEVDNKKVLPCTLWKEDRTGQVYWQYSSLPSLSPLYNLDQIAAKPDAPALVVQNEEFVHVAMALFPFHVVTTVMGGASAVDKADLSALYGKKVTVWASNDNDGHNFASVIVQRLQSGNATTQVSVMKPMKFLPEFIENGSLKTRSKYLPDGWDVTDAMAEGWTAELIKLLPEDMFELIPQLICTRKIPSALVIISGVSKPENVEMFLSQHYSSGLYYCNESFYAYRDGIWSAQDERADIRRKLAEFSGDIAKAKVINDTLTLLKDFQSVREADVNQNKHLICLRNGTLDTKTYQLLKHSPSHGLLTKTDIEWNPNAICSRWLQFLDEIFVSDPDKAEKKQLLQEWMGYCLIPNNSHEKFLWLIGPGGNGKSVFLFILTQVIGSKNISNAHIEKLGDKFALAELENKLVNISSEMSAAATLPDSYLKAIVTGDELQAERKFKPPFTFTPFVRLIGSTNHLPRLLDLSDGFFRRAMILTFNRKFEDANRDPNLKDKLAAELPGILAWAVQGLKNLNERGQFVIPASSVEVLNQYRNDSDTERMFLDECLILDTTGEGMSPNEIYAGYAKWCRDSGYKAKAKNNFGKRLTDLGITSKRGHSSKFWLVTPNPASNVWDCIYIQSTATLVSSTAPWAKPAGEEVSKDGHKL